MKTSLFIFVLLLPLCMHAQQQDDQATIENITKIYDSLPKENDKVKWHESIPVDISFTLYQLGENTRAAFARILSKSREEEFKEDESGGSFSAVGTFKVSGGTQKNFFNQVDGSAEVDYNIEVLFRKGGFTYNIYNVTIITEKERWNQRTGSYSDFGQASLEEAFQKCIRSKSRKIERRIFFETISILQEKIDLLKILMKQSPHQ